MHIKVNYYGYFYFSQSSKELSFKNISFIR